MGKIIGRKRGKKISVVRFLTEAEVGVAESDLRLHSKSVFKNAICIILAIRENT